MGRNRVTLQTIADRLGVSRTTVSNAYNRPDQLATELRERILATAAELGYSGPDPAARRLRSGERNVIALMFEDLSYAVTDPAAVLFLQGMAAATAPEGLALLLLPARREVGGVEMVRDAVVDAFVLYSMPHSLDTVAAARGRGLPVVVVDEPPGEGTAFVGIDDRAAIRAVAAHIVGLGHRRLVVVSDRIGDDDHTGRVDAAAPQLALLRARPPAPRRDRRRVRGGRPHVGGRAAVRAPREHAEGGGGAGAGAARPRSPPDRRRLHHRPAGHRRHARRARAGARGAGSTSR